MRSVAALGIAMLLTACAAPPPAPEVVASPTAAPPSAEPSPTDAGPTVPPGTTPFPTPGPTITPGSTRVIGTLRRPDGTPAVGVCVVLEKGICPIATDDQGVWFTDVPAGPITWNFIYRVDGVDVGRQFVIGTAGGELRLGRYTLTG